jgi:pSer/pThr/pTyr-binding forkhead associated (FHA) protein
MGKLVITDNNGVTTQFDLSAERVTIGRAAGNDIVLNDKATSGRHAAIVTILEDSFLEDLDSTNGTQVNGTPVTKHPLAHGDVITIGRNTLRFFTAEASEAEMDKTMILRPGSIPPAATRPAAARPAGSVNPALIGAGKPVLGKLRITSGANQGREMELSKPLTTLGKPGVQVAAITRRAEGYYIVQVDSTGGRKLRINGADVEPQPRRLSDGDRVELAGTQMEFRVIG